MMEISNNKSYKKYIFLVTIILLAGLTIFLIINTKNVGISVGLFIILETVFLSRRFTDKIAIGETHLSIWYYKWGIRRQLVFDIQDIRAEAGEMVENRGYKYKSLNIYFKNKSVYNLNAGDGFGDSDLVRVEKQISQHSGMHKT